ncbi:MAG: hypothetical protein PHI12_10970 [Dehalococcoidales bacterium]|nr:hypothetical protein [Dehalococcoidales bacterium]
MRRSDEEKWKLNAVMRFDMDATRLAMDLTGSEGTVARVRDTDTTRLELTGISGESIRIDTELNGVD